MEDIHKEYSIEDIRDINSLFDLKQKIFTDHRLEIISLYACITENGSLNAYLMTKDLDLDKLKEICSGQNSFSASIIYRYLSQNDFKIIREEGILNGSDIRIGDFIVKEWVLEVIRSPNDIHLICISGEFKRTDLLPVSEVSYARASF